MATSSVQFQETQSSQEADEGALELFIKAFNQYEADSGLFERYRDADGFAWWDVVRYNIQFALCVEKGIYARSKVAKHDLSSRARSFLRQSLRLIHDAFKIAVLRGNRIGAVYVFLRPLEQLLNEIEKGDCACLIIDEAGEDRDPHRALSKRSVDFFVRLTSRVGRVPQSVACDAAQLDKEIRRRFNSNLDIRRIILAKYRQHQVSHFVWRLVLGRVKNTTHIGFVNDDTLKALIHFANARKITTREFQHGYIGGSHIGYSYPPLSSPVTSLPAEVVVNRDTGDIVYPVRIVKRTASAPATPSSSVLRDIDVLVGGSPTRSAETALILGALVDRGLNLAIKLHPIQTEASSGLRDLFTPEQLQIHAGKADFRALAVRSKVYVPANPTSTTVFEAVEAGARLIVVDYAGQKLTRMVDRIVSRRTGTFEDLYNAVLPHLDQEVTSTMRPSNSEKLP